MNSNVYIEASNGARGTILSDLSMESPYKIMSPFYKDDKMQLMLMCAGPGMFGGDSLSLSIRVKDGAAMEYMTQSFEKIFPSRTGDEAHRLTQMEVGEDACLCYMPKPVLPFAGSRFCGDTTVRIQESSTLNYCDIVACGRVAMDERFQMKQYESRLRVMVGERLVLAEHMRLRSEQFSHDGLGCFGGYTHSGMMYCYSPKPDGDYAGFVRELADKRGIYMGVTGCDMGFVIRALDYQAQKIADFFSEIQL